MKASGFEASLAMGRKYERIFSKHLADKGYLVAMVCDMVHGDRKSPRIFSADGQDIASPDLIGIGADGKAWCFEVKAKTRPAYMYRTEWKGWWHGVDFRLFDSDYRKMASRCPFHFVVCELRTPPYRGAAPPGVTDPSMFESTTDAFVVSGPVWRSIPYEEALDRGHIVEKWSHGKTGWLWPLEAMRVIDVPGSVAVRPAPPQEAAVFLRRPSPSVLAPMSQDAGPLGYQLQLV